MVTAARHIQALVLQRYLICFHVLPACSTILLHKSGLDFKFLSYQLVNEISPMDWEKTVNLSDTDLLRIGSDR